MKKVIFQAPIKESILNYKTGENCYLASCENEDLFTGPDINRIVACCSQELIYNFLFREKLKGQPYTKDQAVSFIKWAARGWQDQSWFVFIIRNSQNKLIGAIDLKSNNLDSSEMGYWADANESGIMSNAVTKLLALAKSAGYKNIYATTMLNNDRSQQVLIRNGFAQKIDPKQFAENRYIFEKNL